jgi:hypothetical protein
MQQVSFWVFTLAKQPGDCSGRRKSHFLPAGVLTLAKITNFGDTRENPKDFHEI